MGRRGTQVTMPYVQAIKTRHGKTLYYFRRDGKRTPLPGTLGEASFMAAYAAAAAASAARRNELLGKAAEIGVQALIKLDAAGCRFLGLTEI